MQTDSAVRPAAREKRRTVLRSGLKNAAEHWQLWVMMLPAIVFIFIFFVEAVDISFRIKCFY